ncbi:hypothetical protein [Nonomuraea sp. NEAU-A123]|nr:hypothetical protein [Nonomuraea sp. NEAU-A123]
MKVDGDVPQGFLQDLQIDSGGEHERGGAVAQVVQPHRQQPPSKDSR